MKNEMLKWCQNVLINKINQEELESKIEGLLEGPLRSKSDYAQEKCIKSFYEPIVYLEKLLLKSEGVHPHDSEEIMNKINRGELTLEDCLKKQNTIQNSISSEISRQFRHFIAFL